MCIRDRNKVVINFDFRSGAKDSGHLDYPLQSYGPKSVKCPNNPVKQFFEWSRVFFSSYEAVFGLKWLVLA